VERAHAVVQSALVDVGILPDTDVRTDLGVGPVRLVRPLEDPPEEARIEHHLHVPIVLVEVDVAVGVIAEPVAVETNFQCHVVDQRDQYPRRRLEADRLALVLEALVGLRYVGLEFLEGRHRIALVGELPLGEHLANVRFFLFGIRRLERLGDAPVGDVEVLAGIEEHAPVFVGIDVAREVVVRLRAGRIRGVLVEVGQRAGEHVLAGERHVVVGLEQIDEPLGELVFLQDHLAGGLLFFLVAVVDHRLRVELRGAVLVTEHVHVAVGRPDLLEGRLGHVEGTVVGVDQGVLAVVDHGHRVDLGRPRRLGLVVVPRAAEEVAAGLRVAAVGGKHVDVPVATEVERLAVGEFDHLEPELRDGVFEVVPPVVVDDDRGVGVELSHRLGVEVVRVDVRDVDVIHVVEIRRLVVRRRVVTPRTVVRPVEQPGVTQHRPLLVLDQYRGRLQVRDLHAS